MDFNTLLPPPEAYKYQPKPEEFKCKVGKQVIRRIFDTELDQDDNKALDLFYAQAQPSDPIWTRPQVLRFLQANQFKIPQTLESMKLYEEWRKTLPIEYDQNVEQFLSYERDRKKVKNVKHNGNLTLEQIKKVARVIEEKSLAKTFTGTVKQVLGTALSLGATVDGQPVKQVIAKINSGELKVE